MNCITASCTIAGHVVHKDGKAVFENTNADLPGFLLSVYQHFDLNYPRFYKMDNLSKLGWLASEILLMGKERLHRPEKTGILLTNANASLDTDLKYFETVKDIPSPSLFGYTLPNIVIGEICIRNNFKGENTFFVFADFDAGFIEGTVGILLDTDILETCICGWVDLLGEEYKAVLFLVEKFGDGSAAGLGSQADPFTRENMDRIFQAGDRE
jgi:hypothetical protein